MIQPIKPSGETKMKLILAFAGAAGLNLAALIFASAPSAQPAESESEAAIRKVIVEMTEGFNSHDGKAASRMYMPEARLVTVRGEVMNGRTAIEKGLSAIFATRAKNATHRTKEVTIRMIRPDVAFAYVTNELSGLVAPDGQSLPAHQELSLRVFVRDGGAWQVAAFHNTMIAPFAPPAR
jgi:uncharacterized protein (TIGR02246 family)